MSRRRAPSRGVHPYTLAKFVFALGLLFVYEQRHTLAEARSALPVLGAALLAVLIVGASVVWLTRTMRRDAVANREDKALPPRPLRRLPRALGGIRVNEEAFFTREMLEEMPSEKIAWLETACRRARGPAAPPLLTGDLDDLAAKLNALEETLRNDLHWHIIGEISPPPTAPRNSS